MILAIVPMVLFFIGCGTVDFDSIDINALNAEQEALDAVVVEDNSDINKSVITQEVNTTSKEGFE